MSDAEDVLEIAMSLPGAVEIESAGFDFRVGGHGFIWSYPELLLGEPEAFFTTPSYDHAPLVMVRLANWDLRTPTHPATW